MRFSPRDYQRALIEHIYANPRVNCWSGMGTGKTSSTLTALDRLAMVEDVYPVLVLAPLRVATSTWPDEVAKWDHLSHLRVSTITGSEAERRRAIFTPAEVYTINYENLPWLIEFLGKKFPYRTVVADESTNLKGFRLRQGAQRPKALARVAHTIVKRFINLTGTPASNGLADLWGQQWFIDSGTRLGRTFSSFTDRWFTPERNGFGIKPLPFAQEEIQERLQDVTITIEAKDYFDLPPLIENIITVDLPPAAVRIYAEMEKKMFAEIGEHGVEAFNAATRTNKCLQIANGAVIVDEAGRVEEIHDAKLQALEDIVEESAGMPVLVSYQFVADRERILKKFKTARHLDDDPETIRKWNRGEIPMLVAHPASAGHGLNLQDGSNVIAYFSSGWNLEEDLQILERLGPTRQAQAGHNRPVFVHRIEARGTVDQLVAARRQSKKSVQDILLEAMKERKAA